MRVNEDSPCGKWICISTLFKRVATFRIIATHSAYDMLFFH